MAVTSLLPLDATNYSRHQMHATERIWTETNCYIDIWVEVLHALGLDPVPANACALSADFNGDQWTFLKYPPEDLRLLYGVEVAEMNVWRPVIDHVEEQLAAGRFLTVEVDSWWLSDTAGVSYRIAHVKSTIVPQSVDRENRRLAYFHNAGYFELSGDDFDGVFRLNEPADAVSLPPYVELVRLDRLQVDDPQLVEHAVRLAHEHLDRRAPGNPVARLGERLKADLAWLASADLETYHRYVFGMLRQCGATAELAGDFLDWLTAHDAAELDEAAKQFRTVAETAKSAQFQLARLARGRKVDVDGSLSDMATAWDDAMRGALAWHER
jgi:hypothetical protein